MMMIFQLKNRKFLPKICKNSWLSNESSKNIKDKLKKMNSKEKDKWFNIKIDLI